MQVVGTSKMSSALQKYFKKHGKPAYYDRVKAIVDEAGEDRQMVYSLLEERLPSDDHNTHEVEKINCKVFSKFRKVY